MISAVVLAAGPSSRFGGTKQLLERRGKPLVQHAVDAADAAGVDEIVVVLGHDAGRVRRALRLPSNARTVENARYAEGQSTSLLAGLDACGPASEGAVVLLADQPGVRAEEIGALVEAFREERRAITRLRYVNGPGPALLAREVWDDVRALRGDVGARELLTAHPEWVHEVAIDADAPPDVDLPGDERRLE